jgi:hypothetical protein
MKNVDGLYLELKPIILKSRRTILSLSKETHASRVTLWRWSNSINTHYPDPYKLISVLGKISGKTDPSDIANYFGGEIKNYISSYFKS